MTTSFIDHDGALVNGYSPSLLAQLETRNNSINIYCIGYFPVCIHIGRTIDILIPNHDDMFISSDGISAIIAHYEYKIGKIPKNDIRRIIDAVIPLLRYAKSINDEILAETDRFVASFA